MLPEFESVLMHGDAIVSVNSTAGKWRIRDSVATRAARSFVVYSGCSKIGDLEAHGARLADS
jgi:hypothetical protein